MSSTLRPSNINSLGSCPTKIKCENFWFLSNALYNIPKLRSWLNHLNNIWFLTKICGLVFSIQLLFRVSYISLQHSRLFFPNQELEYALKVALCRNRLIEVLYYWSEDKNGNEISKVHRKLCQRFELILYYGPSYSS